jgi:hypothetical protein
MDPRWEADCKAMDDDALLAAVRAAPTGEALDAAWGEALRRAELPGQGNAEALLLPEELTPFQRRLAEAFAARAEGDVWTCRIPGTLRLARRWLGMTPPSVLDRRIPWTHEGRAVSWPLWRVWADVPRSSLEHGQGIPRELAETLSPGELIEAAGEAVLEPYGDYGSVLEDRLMAALAHAGDAAPWARSVVETAVAAVTDEGHRQRAVQHFERTVLAVLVLLPLVRAGVPLEPAWDALVPHAGPEALVREVLFALPPDRREAAVHRGITTTWGARGDQVINGFWENLRALEWAPSLRNARFVVTQWRSCSRYYAKARPKIQAAFDRIIAAHPEVAEALKPQRRKASATSEGAAPPRPRATRR